jgi:hypothetical protein
MCRPYAGYARELLRAFVRHYEIVYPMCPTIYNVHSLLDLCDDVVRFGTLDNISAFPFEKKLGLLKKDVCGPSNPLVQMVRRHSERVDNDQQIKNPSSKRATVEEEHHCGPLPVNMPSARQFGKLTVNMQNSVSVLRTREPDNCVIINAEVHKIFNILKSDDQASVTVMVRRFSCESDFYTYPCQSRFLGIRKVRDLRMEFELYPFNDVVSKCVCLPLENYFVVLPMRHKIV